MKIYVDTPFGDRQKNRLKEAAPDDVFDFKNEIEDLQKQLDALLGADILLGNPRPAEWLQRAVNLKWVQLYSTGFEYYRDVSIPAVVTNMKEYYAQPCAETIIAGIMSLYRLTGTFTLLKSARTWVGYPVRNQMRVLSNKRVLILGAGGIAEKLSKILSAFDCELTFYARSAGENRISTLKELLAAIPGADIIIGCLPGTNKTAGLFTAEMISLMKTDAIFCNIGRGNLLADEDALVSALNNNRIGGAVLDVTAEEPLPAGNALWNCPNTILSQHTGGGSDTEYDGIASFFLENLARYKSGEPLQNIIQLKKGY